MVFVSRPLLPPFLSQALTFSGAPNQCGRFNQSLALRSELAEKHFFFGFGFAEGLEQLPPLFVDIFCAVG